MSKDFEQRKRERLKQQRRQRERLRRLQILLSVILLILVIIILVAGITRCSRNKTTASPTTGTVMTTPSPAGITPTSAPAAAQEANGIPAPEEGDNDLLDVISESGEKKHAYLTFDDGPNTSITPQILDTLRRYNVKATFFMIGKNIEAEPQMCARVIEEGHLAAVHSYTHEYDTVYSDSDTFRDEVTRTYDLILANSPAGEEPFKLFRFPGGGFDDSNYGSSKQEYKDVLAEEGFYYADWNSLNGDAEGKTKNAEELLEYFNTYKPGTNNLVVLMHDAEGKQATADMLASLIEQLIDEGFEFNRLDEIDFSNKPAATEDTSAADEDDDTSDGDSSSDTSETGSESTTSRTTRSGSATSSPVSATSEPSESDASSGSSSSTRTHRTRTSSDSSSQSDTTSETSDSDSSYVDEADPEINQ